MASRAAATAVDDPHGAPVDPLTRWPELRPIDARTPLRRYFQDVWARRDFAITVPLGQLRARHQDTALGQLWHLMNPLLLTFVYWLIFGVIADVSRGMDNYLGFLIAGVIPYQFTSKSISQGARLIVSNRSLIQSVHFPRAILPLSAVIGEVVAYASAVVVMLVVMVLTGEQVTAWWLLVVPITMVQAVFNLGLAMCFSRLAFHFRDIQQMLPYVLRLTFYLSGILFPLGRFIESGPGRLLIYNPIHVFIELIRQATMDGTTDPQLWLLFGGSALVLVVGGFVFFRAAETEYGRV